MLTMSLAGILLVGSNFQSAGQKTNTNAVSAKQTAMKEASQASDVPTLPFNVVVIKHTVADYNKWRPFFDADSTVRKEAGMHAIGVARGMENQNEVEVPFRIDDLQKAKTFTSSPMLKNVMQKAGVTSQPNIKFIKVLRMTDALQTAGDYAEISHEVKDFDAWLKVFDAEGVVARSNDGLIDGVVARGIDDPNLVYLVFKITDLEKAKAALVKPERQKIMQEAGVVGKPEIFFGRDQQY